MSVKSPKKTVRLFRLLLGNFIEMNYKLILLTNKVGRNYFEKESGGYYSETGRKNQNLGENSKQATWLYQNQKRH